MFSSSAVLQLPGVEEDNDSMHENNGSSILCEAQKNPPSSFSLIVGCALVFQGNNCSLSGSKHTKSQTMRLVRGHWYDADGAVFFCCHHPCTEESKPRARLA